jgi:hypothetical protein
LNHFGYKFTNYFVNSKIIRTFVASYANQRQTDKYHSGFGCCRTLGDMRRKCMEVKSEKVYIRIGRNSLSFTAFDVDNTACPLRFEPYVVKGGISMPANLREAFKRADLMASDSHIQQAQVLVDTPSMLVPIEQFEEPLIETLFNHSFPAKDEERRIVLYNVLPTLNAVCIFAVNKDLHKVLNDRYERVQFIQAMTPVWHHLHQRSFTGRRNKLYGCFHEKQLDIFSFQQNRFKFANSFEAAHLSDALYFLLYVWKQLRLDAQHDEIHLVGDIPDQDALLQELKRYVQKAYLINPAADFQESPATEVPGLPYDLMTLIVKGR